MARTDYYEDPRAPKANRIVPATFAIVLNDAGEVFLQERSDNNSWALPGGTMNPGESVAQCVTREVKEETGLAVKPEYIVGVYSNPAHIVAYTHAFHQHKDRQNPNDGGRNQIFAFDRSNSSHYTGLPTSSVTPSTTGKGV